MRRVKLDKIDLKILQDLQNHGRMTNVDLARRAGISAPPCLRRMRALEKAGYIQGFHARLNAEKLGYGMVVFAMVGLKNQSEQELSKFEDLVRSWTQVRECYMIVGDFDFLLKIVAEDWEDYQKFLTGVLTAADNVDRVKSTLSIRASKWDPGVPVDVDRGLDPTDPGPADGDASGT